VEAPVWRQLIQEHAATEYSAWEFPEVLYKRPSPGVSMLEHQKQTLVKARTRLLERNPGLRAYLKDTGEIERLRELVVK
jgi:hypothetical protein